MKRNLLISILMLSCMTGMAQKTQVDAPTPKGQKQGVPIGNRGNGDVDKFISGNRAYEIIVQRVDSAKEIENLNRGISELQQKRGELRGKTRGFLNTQLGAAIKTGYATLASQTAVNLTSNLINYTVDYISTAIKNHKERFNNWYSAAKSYRTFSKTLSQHQMIGDFYALPSYNGAFDPADIAFKGIGCRSYFSSEGQDGKRSNHDEYCYIFCSLRKDTVGMKSIVNHSKFLLNIDTICFRPNLCDIPSNTTRKVSRTTDFFEKQSDLNVTLNVKVYSSWFNEAIMLQRDQLLGSFDITMKIDSTDCKTIDGERVFKYSAKNDSTSYQPSTDKSVKCKHQSEISISGESFIVPRSYSMNYDSKEYQPVWGTGEYRVELTLSENCDLNKNYYYAKEYKDSLNHVCQDKLDSPTKDKGSTTIGNAQAVAFANLPGQKYFEKKIWQKEWVEMKSAKKQMPNGNDKTDTYLKGVWTNVCSTIKGSSWTTTFFSPLVTALTDTESKAINEGLGLTSGNNAQNIQTWQAVLGQDMKTGQGVQVQNAQQQEQSENIMPNPNGQK